MTSEVIGMSSGEILSGAAAAGLLLLVYFLFLYLKEQRLADYKAKISLEGKSRRWIEKKAHELERVEAYRLAGDLRAHLAQWETAAELYEKGGHFLRAAECYLEMEESAQAARMFLRSHNFERAAALFLESSDYGEGAEAYLRAGDLMKAASTYELGGNLEAAAGLYLEQGLYRRAAEVYEKNGRWQEAAEAYWRSFGEERARLPEEVALRDSMPLRMLARRAGELYQKAGRTEEAIEAFKSGGWLRESAQALWESKRFAEAAEAYLEIGELLLAAEAFKEAGDNQKAAALRARYHLEQGREREAVHFLEEAGEHEQAAEIHVRLGNWAKAGENYLQAGQYRQAAEMFQKAEEFERAAHSLEKAGDFRLAAKLYLRAGNFTGHAEALEKAGEYLAAGTSCYEHGWVDKAIGILQKVEAGHPDYPAASFLLGQIFKEKGLMDLALEYFRRSAKDQQPERGTLENFYQLGLCLERVGKIGEAAKIFEQILVVDFHYKDVSERVAGLKSAATQVETPVSTVEAPVSARPSTGPRPALGWTHPISLGQDQRYTLLKEIGRGGMGIVYQARDNVLEREIAFKILPANLKEHPQAMRNFFREAKSAAKLNHPNIVTVYDAGEIEGTYYIAMEYVRGETVKEILNREGKLSLKAVLMIAGQVCRALDFAHSHKIVHRDVKSSNIMWTPDKQVKLMDFGLAKVIEEVRGYQTVASGTPYYMSPEQALGRNIDHRTDIYSLGVTMFEMITGRLPFMHGDAAYHHVHSPAPHARSVVPSVPEVIDEIIYKCMQKKPEDRYASAGELFTALKKAMPS